MILSNHSYTESIGWRIQDGQWKFRNNQSLFGEYSFGSRNVDGIARLAPGYLIVKSAGNDADAVGDGTQPPDCPGGFDCIPPTGNAKNILTVGSTTMDGDAVAEHSSRGPTEDGRIKPDVLAKGEHVLTTGSDSTNDYVTVWAGTSIAAPAVSGSAVLLQELYQKTYNTFMLAATLKGLIIHTADDIGNPGPDYQTGWGRMNTLEAAELITSNQENPSHILERTLPNDEIYQIVVNARGGGEPLTATLCWTDLPGNPSANQTDPKLVNDLDIRITNGQGNWEPFILDPFNPNSEATTGDNFRDNVEQIIILNPSSGLYTITVSHKANLQDHVQDFSLILSGHTQTSTDWTQVMIDQIAEKNNQGGGVVIIPEGDFIITKSLTVPPGVSIKGAGCGKTVLRYVNNINPDDCGNNVQKCAYENGEGALFVLANMDEIPEDGRGQSISHLTIDGTPNSSYPYGGSSGIYVYYRNHVSLSNLCLKNLGFMGLLVNESENLQFHDTQLTNCAWSNGWASGSVNVGGVKNIEFYNLTILEGEAFEKHPGDNSFGFGIKQLEGLGKLNEHVNIHHSRILVPEGKIAIEFDLCNFTSV